MISQGLPEPHFVYPSVYPTYLVGVSVAMLPILQVMNDLVVDRGPNPYLTNLIIKCNGRFMTTVQGDGMIHSLASWQCGISFLWEGGGRVF